MLDYITSHSQLSKTPIVTHPTSKCIGLILLDPFQILYGQSIVGAVSIDPVSWNPTKVHQHSEQWAQSVNFNPPLQIRALILENTFTSLPRLIPTTLPFLSPISFLCHQNGTRPLKSR